MRCRQAAPSKAEPQVAVASAEEKALGLLAANNAGIDGSIGIGTSYPSSDWIGAALHEIGHAMGRINAAPRPTSLICFALPAPARVCSTGPTRHHPHIFRSMAGSRISPTMVRRRTRATF